MSTPNTVKIDIIPGKQAPRYGEGTELTCEGVVITERGTEGGLPIVDFKMRSPDGSFYLLCFTGRIVTSIAAAVQGINFRNHGNTDQ